MGDVFFLGWRRANESVYHTYSVCPDAQILPLAERVEFNTSTGTAGLRQCQWCRLRDLEKQLPGTFGS